MAAYVFVPRDHQMLANSPDAIAVARSGDPPPGVRPNAPSPMKNCSVRDGSLRRCRKSRLLSAQTSSIQPQTVECRCGDGTSGRADPGLGCVFVLVAGMLGWSVVDIPSDAISPFELLVRADRTGGWGTES